MSMWHIHLEISQIPNQNPSTVIWQQFLMCQRLQSISQISEGTKALPDETLVSFDVSALSPVLQYL